MTLSDDAKKLQLEVDESVSELRQTLVRTQKELSKAKQRTEELVEATIQACKDATLALGPMKPIEGPKPDKRRKRAEVALWHLTDWQGAKVTPSYNSEIMRTRVMDFTTKATKITEIQRQDHPVNDVVVCFGGDMVEGLFNYPAQLWEIDLSLYDQYITVSRLIVDVVRQALAVYQNVTVIAEWGNHGRIGNKRADVPKSDNFDRMCYELARQLLCSEEATAKRLTWDPRHGVEDIQRIEIGNYRALLMHGDEVGRSGFASPAGWQAAGNRWKAGAYDWEFQDIYLGHYHRHAQEPLSDGLGSVYWTGSTESDNRYARDSMAASGVPSQRLHFIDPERGRVTACYQVWLD
jgi:hypothetical protein